MKEKENYLYFAKVGVVNVDATTTELNVAHFAAGAYLMEVTVDGQTGTYKLIKQ